MRRLADIVAFAHRLSPPIVHRDLKPANILLQRAADGRVSLRVADFGIGGIAARQAVEQTRRGTTRGEFLATAIRGACTPLYASPQQMRGDPPDPRDDVFSLGVIWHQLLTGDMGAGRPGGSGWRKRLAERGMAAPLIELLEACIEDNLADRPADAAVLAERFAALLAAPQPRPAREGTDLKPDMAAFVAQHTSSKAVPASAASVSPEGLGGTAAHGPPPQPPLIAAGSAPGQASAAMARPAAWRRLWHRSPPAWEAWHYLDLSGVSRGPVPAEELRRLCSVGLLMHTSMIWKPGLPAWLPAASVPGLLPAPPLALSVPPVPAQPSVQGQAAVLDPAPNSAVQQTFVNVAAGGTSRKQALRESVLKILERFAGQKSILALVESLYLHPSIPARKLTGAATQPGQLDLPPRQHDLPPLRYPRPGLGVG
jgi:hypothetical protein